MGNVVLSTESRGDLDAVITITDTEYEFDESSADDGAEERYLPAEVGRIDIAHDGSRLFVIVTRTDEAAVGAVEVTVR